MFLSNAIIYSYHAKYLCTTHHSSLFYPVILQHCSYQVISIYFTFKVENSVDPDQMVSSEASWSGSTVFRNDLSGLSRTRVNCVTRLIFLMGFQNLLDKIYYQQNWVFAKWNTIRASLLIPRAANKYQNSLPISVSVESDNGSEQQQGVRPRMLRPCHTTTYSTNVCRRMKTSASTLVYAEYVRNKL